MTRGLLGALSLSMTLLLGACGGSSPSGGSSPTMVAVPNITGLAQAAATSAITGAGLQLGTVTTQASGTITSGGVISQSPAAGTSVATGSSVALVVSSGPAPVTVPNVVGMTQANASAAITAASLTPGVVSTQTSTTVAAGVVISQNPAAGASAPMGMNVALVVSVGPPVSVPPVVGMTQSAATSTIQGVGLVVSGSTTQTSATVAAGSIISENPAAGTPVAPGSGVALVVSLGPPVIVPNVVNQTQAAASTAITGIGLALGNVTTQSSPTVAVGLVISENPAAGTSVAPASSVNLVVSSGPAPPNTLTIVIDSGPPSLVQIGQVAVNEAFATVTICTPGSTTACQAIDHVLVDTGSVGLQIVSGAITGANPPVPTLITDPNTNGPLRECVQFADGYSWGSMVVADVTIGQRKISNLPVHLIGDTAAGTAPSSCSTKAGPAENTVATFGSNGVLGVGYFLQDCGSICATNVVPSAYYGCPASGCQEVTVATNLQLQNPVGAFSTDNNGVLISLPAVAAPGVATVTGTLYFGVSTQANNAIGTATIYTVDDTGELLTTFGSPPVSYNQSFIDSGSNGYFFSSSLPACKTATGFFCPTTLTPESAMITGRNGPAITIDFNVDNAETLFAMPKLTAYPDLAGSNALPAGGTNNSFDWGLPFFYGRNTFVLFETATVNGTLGPASAF
jgi:beta-lactam-binding protein with PASTA domain